MNPTLKRSLSGVVFILVMVGGLLCSPYGYAALFLSIALVMHAEFLSLSLRPGEGTAAVKVASLAVTAVGFLSAAIHFQFPRSGACVWGGWAVFLALMALVALLIRHHARFRDLMASLAAIPYLSVPFALSPRVVYASGTYDGRILVALLAIVWASDVGGYCLGMLFGQRKGSARLAPAISPGKSWAGFWGGLAFAFATGLCLRQFGLLPISFPAAALLCAVMHGTGVLGDLFESLWKRAYGVKDAGNLVPGHGGLLDRFDSALFALPAGWLCLVSLHCF